MKKFSDYLPFIVILLALLVWLILQMVTNSQKVNSIFQALVFGAILGTLIHQYLVFSRERADKIFFELMGWHRELKNSIEGKVNVQLPFEGRGQYIESRGINFLSNISKRIIYSIECDNRSGIVLNNIDHFLREEYNDNESSLQELFLKFIRRLYEEKIHSDYDVHLSSYFRSLYNTIISIEKKDITSKRNYTDVLQSYLTQPELHILMYNGLTEYGSKFRKLIEEYSLLENIRIDIASVGPNQHDPIPINQAVALKWLLFKTFYPRNFNKFCKKEWNDCRRLDQNLEHFTQGINGI